MDTNDVIKIHEGLCEHAQALMRKKQADYTSGEDQPFRNFQLGPLLGVGNVQQGIFIRFLDKVSRLSTYMTRGKFQVNESLQDTIVDAINYLVLLKASVILEEAKSEKPSEEIRCGCSACSTKA